MKYLLTIIIILLATLLFTQKGRADDGRFKSLSWEEINWKRDMIGVDDLYVFEDTSRKVVCYVYRVGGIFCIPKKDLGLK